MIIFFVSCNVLDWHDQANSFKGKDGKAYNICISRIVNKRKKFNLVSSICDILYAINTNDDNCKKDHDVSKYMGYRKNFNFPNITQK